MAELREIQVGLIVSASGQDGRFEIVEIKDHTARIRLLANKKDTGEPVELNYIIEVPISALTALEELRYWYLQCKICEGSHREPCQPNTQPRAPTRIIAAPNASGRRSRKMIMRNNRGEVVAEINTAVTQDGTTVITNTMYYGKRVVSQHVSVRDSQGNVKTTDVLGGKILP
jgi:hypothetical protein